MLSAGRPMSGKYKLSVLRNHLIVGSLAHKLIFDLEITNENYELAIEALKDEFLHSEYIRDQLFEQISNRFPTSLSVWWNSNANIETQVDES